MRVVQVPMDKELLERLDRQAQSQDVPRAVLIREACRAYLRDLERAEMERRYVEGYERVPEEVGAQESLAWLAAASLPTEEWPESRRRDVNAAR